MGTVGRGQISQGDRRAHPQAEGVDANTPGRMLENRGADFLHQRGCIPHEVFNPGTKVIDARVQLPKAAPEVVKRLVRQAWEAKAPGGSPRHRSRADRRRRRSSAGRSQYAQLTGT